MATNESQDTDARQAHEYIRHLYSITITWFNWAVGFHYAALGAIALNLGLAQAHKGGTIGIAVVFSLNCVLGVVWMEYLRRQTVRHVAAGASNTAGMLASYAFGARLLAASLMLLIVAWLSLIVLLLA